MVENFKFPCSAYEHIAHHGSKVNLHAKKKK